jgi:ribosome-binding factor A
MRHAPRSYKRTDRIADQMQRDLAVLLQREVHDARIGMVTLSSVKVSRDLAWADIYVTFMQHSEPEAIKNALAALGGMSGFLRTNLASQLKLRTIPKLRFHYDETIVQGARMDSLIRRAIQEDAARAPHSDTDIASDGDQ